jgi:NAD(P)-dependent dehydrogenase (short-subunit alcohol dehydrogenase family)
MTSTAPSASSKPPRPKSPHFPPHNAPRVWFITRGVSPIAIALARQVLEHGDYVVAGVMPIEFEKREGQSDDFRTFLEDVKQTERWREHLRVVGLDSRQVMMQRAACAKPLMVFCRVVGQCQAAVAEAVEAFGRIDVLLCAASEGTHLNHLCIMLTNLHVLQLLLAQLRNSLRVIEQ